MIDWLFRNRRTGEITIGQFPNLALWLFLAATVAGRLGPPDGVGTVLRIVAAVSLTWWAGDEVLRGVNPWRRLLGALVLAAEVRRYIA